MKAEQGKDKQICKRGREEGMSRAGKKIIAGLKEALAVTRGDPDAISRIRVTPSCGCVFCDLRIPLHEDAKGFHHVGPKGERVSCKAEGGRKE